MFKPMNEVMEVTHLDPGVRSVLVIFHLIFFFFLIFHLLSCTVFCRTASYPLLTHHRFADALTSLQQQNLDTDIVIIMYFSSLEERKEYNSCESKFYGDI